jgi:hypothetical protein
MKEEMMPLAQENSFGNVSSPVVPNPLVDGQSPPLVDGQSPEVDRYEPI